MAIVLLVCIAARALVIVYGRRCAGSFALKICRGSILFGEIVVERIGRSVFGILTIPALVMIVTAYCTGCRCRCIFVKLKLMTVSVNKITLIGCNMASVASVKIVTLFLTCGSYRFGKYIVVAERIEIRDLSFSASLASFVKMSACCTRRINARVLFYPDVLDDSAVFGLCRGTSGAGVVDCAGFFAVACYFALHPIVAARRGLVYMRRRVTSFSRALVNVIAAFLAFGLYRFKKYAEVVLERICRLRFNENSLAYAALLTGSPAAFRTCSGNSGNILFNVAGSGDRLVFSLAALRADVMLVTGYGTCSAC